MRPSGLFSCCSQFGAPIRQLCRRFPSDSKKVSTKFAALSTERHGSKWIGEYETLVVDDKRRVLHALWTQPVLENGRPIARIFHAAAKLR